MTQTSSLARREDNGALAELVLLQGDLSRLKPEEKTNYYIKVCESLGLNYLTRPFEYLTLNGKQILYARRDCADQLRQIHGVTITICQRERVEDVYVVTARATLPSGRCDESTGAVPLGTLKGEALANALMKAETKAKRRVTLSICGLSMLDETELDTLPQATERRQQIAPHIEVDETGDEAPHEDSPFAELNEELTVIETAVDALLVPGAKPDWQRILELREQLGSKAKMSPLLKRLQEATEQRRIVPDERKLLGKNWQRTARKLDKLEANTPRPDALDAFSDPPDEDEGQGYVPPGQR